MCFESVFLMILQSCSVEMINTFPSFTRESVNFFFYRDIQGVVSFVFVFDICEYLFCFFFRITLHDFV